jgi:hypothetical protein
MLNRKGENMKKLKFFVLGLLTLGALAGCGQPKTDPARDAAVLDEVIDYVPLVVDKTTGDRYKPRLKEGDDIHEMLDGNDLIVVISGVRKSQNFSVTWSYYKAEGLASFRISDPQEGATNTLVSPGYEEYDPKFLTSGDENRYHIPAPKIGRLMAEVKLNTATRKVVYDFKLHAQWRINWKDLVEARDSEPKELIGVRGYVTAIFPDWDSLSIADGNMGYNFYKVSGFKDDGIKVGDLVGGVGEAGGYNGLSQISWIKRINILDPAEFPQIRQPEYNTITVKDFYDFKQSEGFPEEQMENPLWAKDSSLIKINEPLKMVRITDRDGNEIPNVPQGNTHSNIVLIGKHGEIEVEILCSLSYHMGTENQAAFDEFFQAHKGEMINYEGHLTWYNKPNLGPYTVDALKLVA